MRTAGTSARAPRHELRRVLMTSLLGVGLASGGLAPVRARAAAPVDPPAAGTSASAPPETALSVGTAPPAERDATAERDAADPEAYRQRHRWVTCATESDPCTRPRPARALLLGLGVLGGAAAAGLLFGIGDRLVQADPATLLVGLSGLAGAGAIAGAIAGRLGADGTAVPDRLRPPTASLAYNYRGPAILDEARPHAMTLRFAPNLFLPHDHGRLRLFGHFGGWLGPRREVDPRPQFTEVPSGQQGTAPAALEQRRLSIGVGLDLAVALPYPVLAPRRSARLGRTELRFKPEVQIRRERFAAPGSPEARLVERTMLLPLTVGARWELSARQRFTAYAGPRFDFISFSDPGSGGLRRGGALTGPLYAEAWYDIDVPLTPGHRGAVDAIGQINLGYIHSRFDGQGFDFGPVIGFLGPVHVGWSTRLRPRGAPVAAQLGVSARIGNGVTMGAQLGLVAPDLHARPRPRR